MTWRPRYSYIDGSYKTFDPSDARTWQTFTPTSWGGEADLATHTVNSAAYLQDEMKLLENELTLAHTPNSTHLEKSFILVAPS